MAVLHRFLLTPIALLVIASLGCDHSPGPKAQDPKTSPQQKPDDTATSNATKKNEPTTPPVEKVNSSEAENDAHPDKTATEKESIVKPAPATKEALLLLAPSGPLIVEFAISVDGLTIDDAMASVVEELLKSADSNKNGVATWDEAFATPRIMYGGFGNMRVDGDVQQRQVKQLHDTNRNGELDRDEARRFIASVDGSSRAVTLTESSYFRELSQSRSPLRIHLDANGDGLISRNEIEDSTSRLLVRDGDDDRVLYPSDFLSTENLQDDRTTRRGFGGPPTAIMLRPLLYNASGLLYDLEELYAFGDPLASSSFPLTPRLFGELDENQNSKLTTDELKRIDTLTSHLILSVALARGKESKPTLSHELRLGGMREKVQLISRDDSRLAVVLPDGRFDVVVRDTPQDGSVVQRSEALVTQFDTDKNGYLEQKEIGTNEIQGVAPFSAVDLDADEKVFASEIEIYLRVQQTAQQSRIRIDVRYREDSLFPALDISADGRLDEREILSAPEQLSKLDSDNDDGVSIDEIPGSMTMIITRGGNMQSSANLDVVDRSPPADNSAPDWFRSMDENQDGFVSETEFLGTSDQFNELDSDGDRFIEPDEISATDANSPVKT